MPANDSAASMTPAQPSGRERRAHPRRNADVPIQLSHGGSAFEARVRDVSRSGICFFLDRPLPPMTVLQVRLRIGAAREVAGNGAVVRCEKISKALEHYEIALFLHDMTDDDRRVLERFVSQSSLASR